MTDSAPATNVLCRISVILALPLGLGCAPLCSLPCGTPPATVTPEPCDQVYVGQGDPYMAGELAVRRIAVRRCEQGAPRDLLIFAPEAAGAYPVVVFQHGFMSRNSYYSQILEQLASHGFVVVAPQMYEPGLPVLFGNPSAAEEADQAAQILAWLPGHLDEITGVRACTERLGLAGHSRGGKVVWQMMVGHASLARAIAGIDPVDGTGGPLGGQDRVVQGPFSFSVPALVLGTGLGGQCAPEGDNHVQFYAASQSPAWHVVATQAGHADMLDADAVEFASQLCPAGDQREGMRRLTAGLMVALFRASLQDDPKAFDVLTDVEAAPTPITAEVK